MSSTTYNYEAEDEGKVLTKTQIRNNLCHDQSSAETINKNLSDAQIRNFVTDLLVQRGRLELNFAHQLMTPKAVQLMRQAFTHWSIYREPNYEVLETLGDTTYNKVITYYIYRRFPELGQDPDGNSKITESTKLYKSKNQAPIFSDKLGLPSMARYRALFYYPQPITFPHKVLQLKMDNKLKTDLFEAFIAAIEEIIDGSVSLHSGYVVVYNILESLFDEINIKIDLQSTLSNKTKVKEVCDRLRGRITYNKMYRGDDTIGIEMVIRFEESVKLTDGSYCRTKSFKAFTRGYEAGCDQAAVQALEWLRSSCGLSW